MTRFFFRYFIILNDTVNIWYTNISVLQVILGSDKQRDIYAFHTRILPSLVSIWRWEILVSRRMIDIQLILVFNNILHFTTHIFRMQIGDENGIWSHFEGSRYRQSWYYVHQFFVSLVCPPGCLFTQSTSLFLTETLFEILFCFFIGSSILS